MFALSIAFNRKNDMNLCIGTGIFVFVSILYYLDIFDINYSVARYFMKFALYFELGLLVKHLETKGFNDSMFAKNVGSLILLIISFIAYYLTDVKLFLIFTSVLGIMSVLFVSHVLNQNIVLGKLGNRSMDIYLLHGPIMVAIRWGMTRIHANSVLISILMFFGSLALSIVISNIIHRYAIFDVVCFGNFKRIEKGR